jgi:hypothetical protein
MERFLLYLQRLMMQIHRFHDGKTKLLILSCNTISYHYWREREMKEKSSHFIISNILERTGLHNSTLWKLNSNKVNEN